LCSFLLAQDEFSAHITALEAIRHENGKSASGRVGEFEVTYEFTLGDKVSGAIEGLRMGFLPRRILVAGPYMGELGYELMEWQAWVRAQVPRYWEVHVITFPGRDALYPGCVVHTHDVPLERAGLRHGRFSPAELKSLARAKAKELGLKNYDILTAQTLCTPYHRQFILPAKFELLRKDPLQGRYRDLAFHFRWVKNGEPDLTQDYPLELCDRVAAMCQKKGHSVCCVGHPRYSYCPAGVEDLRSEDLEASITAISSARILAGELSGPMQLAQLCGVPISVWSDNPSRLDNSERWNVLRVPTFVVANDTNRPEVERVVQAIDRALLELRLRSENFTLPAYMPPE